MTQKVYRGFQDTRTLFLLGLINLSIVAFLGIIMRIKIGFEFPYLNQKNILLGHFYFAFSGWVTHVLYTFLQDFLHKNKQLHYPLSICILINYFFSFGLLISFFTLGYHLVSIFFILGSLLNSYYFAWKFFEITKEELINHPSIKWFKSALFFQVISSLGSIYLAWMMYSGNFNQTLYLGSVYFFLHFQYSGWFFFNIIGFLVNLMRENFSYSENINVYRLFTISAIPAFLLSILWINLPWYLFCLALLAVFIQLTALKIFIKNIAQNFHFFTQEWNLHVKLLMCLFMLAFIIKILLQSISIIPSISQWAFGYRSIVIAYLHLVLLGMTTLFLFGYAYKTKLLLISKYSFLILCIFCFSVFANEVALMIQGVAGLAFIIVPFMAEILLFISCLLFISLVVLMIHEKVGNTLVL